MAPPRKTVEDKLKATVEPLLAMVSASAISVKEHVNASITSVKDHVDHNVESLKELMDTKFESVHGDLAKLSERVGRCETKLFDGNPNQKESKSNYISRTKNTVTMDVKAFIGALIAFLVIGALLSVGAALWIGWENLAVMIPK